MRVAGADSRTGVRQAPRRCARAEHGRGAPLWYDGVLMLLQQVAFAGTASSPRPPSRASAGEARGVCARARRGGDGAADRAARGVGPDRPPARRGASSAPAALGRAGHWLDVAAAFALLGLAACGPASSARRSRSPASAPSSSPPSSRSSRCRAARLARTRRGRRPRRAPPPPAQRRRQLVAGAAVAAAARSRSCSAAAGRAAAPRRRARGRELGGAVALALQVGLSACTRSRRRTPRLHAPLAVTAWGCAAGLVLIVLTPPRAAARRGGGAARAPTSRRRALWAVPRSALPALAYSVVVASCPTTTSARP